MRFKKFIVQAFDGGEEVTFPAPEMGLIIAKRKLAESDGETLKALGQLERQTVESTAWVVTCASFSKAGVDVPAELTVDSLEDWAMRHVYDFAPEPEDGEGCDVQENPTGTRRENS